MAIINMHDAKTQLSDLVARAEAGEEIVIARRNKPAVKLIKVEADSKVQSRKSREQAFGSMAHLHDAMKDVDWFEHAPDDYISKEAIAAYYRKYPYEWDEMVQRVGFAESEQAEFELTGLQAAVDAGKEYTIMRDGKAVAKVAPVDKKPRVPGRFAHLRGNLPPDLFDQSLSKDELDAWEGKYSGDGGR